jgi:hypothetical protein
METSFESTEQTKAKRRLHIRKLWRIRHILKWMPSKRSLDRFPVLGRFSVFLRQRKYLWSFKESRVAPAILIGSVIAFLPIFGVQLLTVVVIALLLKVNLPVIVGLQFVSNTLTLVPIYLANYKVGAWSLNSLGLHEAGSNSISFGLNSTLLGGMILGTLFGLVVYGLYLVRIKWDFGSTRT